MRRLPKQRKSLALRCTDCGGIAEYCNGKARLSSARLRHRLAKKYGAKALRGLERKAKAQFIGAVDAMAEHRIVLLWKSMEQVRHAVAWQ